MLEYTGKNLWSRACPDNMAISVYPSARFDMGDVVSRDENDGKIVKYYAEFDSHYIELTETGTIEDLVLKTASDGDTIPDTAYTVEDDNKIVITDIDYFELESIYAAYTIPAEAPDEPQSVTETLTVKTEQVPSGMVPLGIVLDQYDEDYTGEIAIITRGCVNVSLVNDFNSSVAAGLPGITFEEV